MSARLASGVWVAAYLRRVELEGASAHVVRRGSAEAGAVALKLVALGQERGAPNAALLTQASFGDGRSGWIWAVGPDWAAERDVDARIARQARFDPDLWVIEVEDRDGRHFLDDPIG